MAFIGLIGNRRFTTYFNFVLYNRADRVDETSLAAFDTKNSPKRFNIRISFSEKPA